MRFAAIVNLFLATILFSGCQCSKESPRETAPPIQESLRWLTPSVSDRLDWSNCSENDCNQLASLVMAGLVRLEWEKDELVALPSLASQWKFITPTRLQMRLREDVTWTNGEKFTSQHVVLGIRTSLRLKNKMALHLLSPVVNAAPFANGKAKANDLGVKAIDLKTVEFDLKESTPHFVNRLAHPVTFPVFQEKPPKTWRVTLGPFRLASWKRNQSAHLTRNTSFFGTPPSLKEIELIATDRDGAGESLFRDGEIDFWDSATPEKLGPDESNHLVTLPGTSTLALAIDRSQIPDRELRTLLLTSIDRKEALRLLRFPHLLASHLLPVGADAQDAAILDYKAPNLKPAASARNLSWTLSCSKDPWHSEVCLNVAAQLGKNLGAKIELRNEPTSTLHLVEFSPDLGAPLLGLESFLDAPGKAPLDVREAEALIISERIVLPLYRRVHTTLQRAGAKLLTLNALGFWEASGTESRG